MHIGKVLIVSNSRIYFQISFSFKSKEPMEAYKAKAALLPGQAIALRALPFDLERASDVVLGLVKRV